MQETDFPGIAIYRNGGSGSEKLRKERTCELFG